DMGEDLPQEDFIPGSGPAVTKKGDLWRLGRHRILCGDARKPNVYARLMNGAAAAAVFADPPYNVPIGGHAQGRGRIKHPDFVVASGEIDEEVFHAFLKNCLAAVACVSRGGAIHYVCMDWRHIETLVSAGRAIYEELLNIAVWNKTNLGQGSFYRSQHEFIAVFRVGPGKHQNNVQLGRHGRNRSNVWTYPGVSSLGAERNKILAMHPTVKPVVLVADATRDCTGRGDIVLDPFLGSGTTVIAAEKVGRVCYGLEIDPSHVDVAVRRWQEYTDTDAVLEGDGRTFDEVAAERLAAGAVAGDEAQPESGSATPSRGARQQGL
ncbi:MAG: DNA-methyltransferase, partial [Methylocystis sp.]|uniref:DNA-methyltransferase n=1 Tax=Methylocystis sp. TaxID=1911079 RepID=UPI003DA585D8